MHTPCTHHARTMLQAVGHNHRGCCLQQLGHFERAAEAHQAHLDLQLGESRHLHLLSYTYCGSCYGYTYSCCGYTPYDTPSHP